MPFSQMQQEGGSASLPSEGASTVGEDSLASRVGFYEVISAFALLMSLRCSFM